MARRKIKKILLIMMVFISVVSLNGVMFSKVIPKENTIYQKEYKENKSVSDEIISLYIWNVDDVNLAKLKDEVEYLKINTLYISLPEGKEQKERFKLIDKFAELYQLDVFILGGSRNTRDALTNSKSKFVTEFIDEANKLNKELDYKIKGVSLDIEFYLTDEYQNGTTERQKELFKTYTTNNKKACDYANKLGLEYSMALPVWLNKLDIEVLEELMNYNYDHIAFMNYYKETVMENIDEEVEIAKKHNIKIVSISELQDPSKGSVGEEDTFFNDGLSKCMETLKALKEKYAYDKLGISYHYYVPLLDVLKRDTDVGIQNKYELGINIFHDKTKTNVDEITISDKNVKYIKDSSKIILLGLEYGKEYTVTVKKDKLISIKKFKYEKDSNLGKLEKTSVDMNLVKDTSKPAKEEKPNVDNTSNKDNTGKDKVEAEEQAPNTTAEFNVLKVIGIGIIVLALAILSEIDDVIIAKDEFMKGM